MSTFVQLTNELLRRLNEVPLDTAGDGFDTVRNVQSVAKDAINSSLREIYQNGQEWNFLKTTYTQTLTAGTREYNFPSDFSTVDWETFYLKKHSTQDNAPRILKPMSYEEYLSNFRPSDDEGDQVNGEQAPERVFQTFDEKFGVTPIPNSDYEVEYVYWTTPSTLSAFDDACVVPERFNHVILDGAMAYMMHFRSNEQSAAIHQSKFDSGIRSMKRILFDDKLYLRSTMIERSSRWTI
jgi:hypothetical protein